MLFSRRRTIAKLAKIRHLTFRGRRLTFERLEDRCLLSAQPVSLLTGEAVLAAEPGKDLQTLSLLTGNDGVTDSPSVPQASVPQDGRTILRPLQVGSSQAVQVGTLLDPKIIPPDGHNAPMPPQKPHLLTNIDDSQNAPLSDDGDSLAGKDSAEKPSLHVIGDQVVSTSGFEITGPLLSIGNLPTGPRRTGGNALPGKLTLLVHDVDSGRTLVPTTGSALHLSTGLLSGQGKTLNGFARHSVDGLIASATAIFSGSEASGDRTGLNSLVENGDIPQGTVNEALLRWLASGWTGQIQNGHIGEALAYPNDGTGQTQPQSAPSPNETVERLINGPAGIGSIERGPQASAYPVNVARPFRADVAAGGEAETIDKPTGGTVTPTMPVAVSELLADGGASPSAESARRDLIVSVGMTALVSEFMPAQEAATLDAGNGHHLVMNRGDGAVSRPVLPNRAPSSQTDVSVARLELFQLDVAATGPVSSDPAIASTTGSTAVYLAHEESSIWSIVTTYALVIIPRQRKHQPTILVVDPDDATRDALNVALVREGYFVLPAASVRDAWGTLRTPHARIDLVLMDPHLPDVSGIHLCARLREISPTLPVMVCAGEVEPSEVAQLQQLGVRYYLRKPVAFEELLYTVKTLLR
jgi:CheY-like chemotaxis protein